MHSTQRIPFSRELVVIGSFRIGQASVPMLCFGLKPVIQISAFRASALLKNFLSSPLDVLTGRIAVEGNEFAHSWSWLVVSLE